MESVDPGRVKKLARGRRHRSGRESLHGREEFDSCACLTNTRRNLCTKRLLACLLSVSLSLARPPPQAAEIRGKVVGAPDNPIAAAVVLHRASGAKTETDAEGAFRPRSSRTPDRFVLEVVHPDYYEREFEIEPKELASRSCSSSSRSSGRTRRSWSRPLRYPEPSIQVPAASTVISGETLSEEMVPNINEGLQDVPGVGALGSAGFSLVPSVRGLARRRVLYLIDGARLESDRRTGPNASFVSPDDIERIEVLRSASSVFYGSDAIGGVIHILTRNPASSRGLHGRFLTGYGTVNGENRIGLGLDGSTGTWAFSLSFHRDDAGLYRAPGGTKVLQSQFTQGSLLAKAAHRTDKREIDIGILAARGTDIGKPSTTASTKPTWYPRENQNLVQLHWKEKNVGKDGEILFHAFVNPNFLETLTDTYDGFLTKESYAKTDSTEFGAQASYSKKLAPALRLEGGVDYFGRAGAHAYNKYTGYDEFGAVTGVRRSTPTSARSRGDLGFFLSADFSGIKRLDILGGVRYDLLRMKAQPQWGDPGCSPAADRDHGQPADRLPGRILQARQELTAFVNVSRAYRLASINERFYTGISGRGFIVGQPGPSAGKQLQPRRRAQAPRPALLPRPLRVPLPDRRYDRALSGSTPRPIPTGTSKGAGCGDSSSRPRRSSCRLEGLRQHRRDPGQEPGDRRPPERCPAVPDLRRDEDIGRADSRPSSTRPSARPSATPGRRRSPSPHRSSSISRRPTSGGARFLRHAGQHVQRGLHRQGRPRGHGRAGTEPPGRVLLRFLGPVRPVGIVSERVDEVLEAVVVRPAEEDGDDVEAASDAGEGCSRR